MKKLIILTFIIISTTLFFIFIFRLSKRIFFKPQAQIPEKIESVENNSKDFQLFAQNLKIPWEIVFLPDKRVLITERVGSVKIFDFNGSLINEFRLSEVVHRGEGGLLGAQIHPNFSQNGFLYLYYTTEKNAKIINQLVRFVLKEDKLTKEKIILDNIPAGLNHNGGRIKFGPDGYLYVTTGDSGDSNLAQDRNSLGGKILRVRDDGSIPEDNPFKNSVFAWGIRNSQGITWDTQGRLWATDHGRSGLKSGLDEINLIEVGKNYGWPVIQGDQSKEGMQTPILHSGEDITWAPADILYYKGFLFFTGLRGEGLYRLKVEGDKLSDLKVFFFKEFGRLRALTLGLDGFFYISTSNTDGRGTPREGDDKIIKINPQFLI